MTTSAPDSAASGAADPAGAWAADPTDTTSPADRFAVPADLDDRPLAEHADIYQGLHARLQAALSDIDGA